MLGRNLVFILIKSLTSTTAKELIHKETHKLKYIYDE